MSGVDRVLGEVRQKGATAVFTISTKLARAKLPDGRNAHVTLLTRSEWIRWVSEVFGKVEPLASNWEHELVLLAGSEAINARRRAAAAKPRIAA
jgi:superfamily I DNA and RNA helicase